MEPGVGFSADILFQNGGVVIEEGLNFWEGDRRYNTKNPSDPQAMQSLKQFARKLKTETYALYLASKDPRVPWYARVLAAGVVAYLFSPIDLIPDAIPILGYLDDLILVPLGIWIVLKMIPPQVMAECREQAEAANQQGTPKNWIAAAIIVFLWIFLGLLTFHWIGSLLNS